MANVNDPNGFTPAYHMTGGTIRPSEFAIQSGATGDIFAGDVVKLTSGYVLQGGATDAPLGVFYGVEYVASDGEIVFSRKWPSGTTTQGSADAKAFVYADPNIAYEAQYTGTPTQADIGDVALFLNKASIEVKIENDDYLIVPQSAILILIRDDLEELTK